MRFQFLVIILKLLGNDTYKKFDKKSFTIKKKVLMIYTM